MAPIPLSEPYRPRPIRFLELWQTGDWRIKVYGIAYRRDRPAEFLVEAAKEIAAERLASVEPGAHYGVGFLGVHQGKTGNFVFIDWWSAENELSHHVFFSSSGLPGHLHPATAEDPIACVWDLAVIDHERRAWIDCVLARPDGPDVEAYLDRRMSEDV